MDRQHADINDVHPPNGFTAFELDPGFVTTENESWKQFKSLLEVERQRRQYEAALGVHPTMSPPPPGTSAKYKQKSWVS